MVRWQLLSATMGVPPAPLASVAQLHSSLVATEQSAAAAADAAATAAAAAEAAAAAGAAAAAAAIVQLAPPHGAAPSIPQTSADASDDPAARRFGTHPHSLPPSPPPAGNHAMPSQGLGNGCGALIIGLAAAGLQKGGVRNLFFLFVMLEVILWVMAWWKGEARKAAQLGSVLLLLSHLVRVAIACTSDPIQFEKELERWVSAPLQVLALVTISICAGGLLAALPGVSVRLRLGCLSSFEALRLVAAIIIVQRTGNLWHLRQPITLLSATLTSFSAFFYYGIGLSDRGHRRLGVVWPVS